MHERIRAFCTASLTLRKSHAHPTSFAGSAVLWMEDFCAGAIQGHGKPAGTGAFQDMGERKWRLAPLTSWNVGASGRFLVGNCRVEAVYAGSVLWETTLSMAGIENVAVTVDLYFGGGGINFPSDAIRVRTSHDQGATWTERASLAPFVASAYPAPTNLTVAVPSTQAGSLSVQVIVVSPPTTAVAIAITKVTLRGDRFTQTCE
jgi:hypothetical protein